MRRDTKRTLTIEEVAVVLGISPNTIYRALERGECPLPVLRFGRRLVVPEDALERILRGESNAGAEADLGGA